ncbi:MAG: DUF4369 domain-containing protein [Prevotella sp.]|jgi:hypothetical protein|nr:DUF4369 domain-containing protein [Prevotella sp.]
MRKSIILLLALLSITACQRNTFHIEGIAEGFTDGDTLFLMKDLNTQIPTDTILVKEGAFELSGEADTTLLSLLYVQKNPELNTTLFLEPGTIDIVMSHEEGQSVIGGTPANIALQEANDIAITYGKKMEELTQLATTPDITQALGLNIAEQLKQLQSDMIKRIQELAERNRDNAFGQFIHSHLENDTISIP